MQREAHSLGWTWTDTPWAFARPRAEPVPLVGGPNGFFSHALREGIRHRELAKAVKRRPELEGAERVDRRALFALSLIHI